MGFGTASISSPKINQLSIQSSSLGLPITLGWGTGRVRCNLIWYNDFTAIPQTTKSGGKGGVKQTSYTYTASIIMGLSAGEILGVPTIYRDKDVFKDNEQATNWDGTDYTITAYTALQQAGLNLATGTTTQTAWGYLTSTHPDQALAYRDIAYVYAQNYPLNDNAAIPNHSFEVKFSTYVSGTSDANPKDVVVDLLTNPNHGVPGWVSGLIGDLSNWSAYCLSNNLLISPVINTARAARDLINEWCEISNSAAFWSEGVLKVGTFGDAAATANGVTYTPNLTPIYALTESDFIPLDDYIPVSLEIRNQADACNIVQVEFLDRANQYNVAIAPSQDLANINEYGRRKQDPVNWHSICDASVARQSSQLLLQRTLYRRELYRFKLPWNFVLLDPMDYVSLTTTTDQLKLNNRLVQIISIEEGEDDCLEFVAEGVDAGTGSTPLYSAYSGDAVSVQTQMAPVPVSPPVIVKAPSSLTGLDPEVWLAVAGANPNWGGCQVWISADGIDYQQVGSITSPAKVGVTTNTLPDHADPDTTNTLTVNMSLSGQELNSASATNANSGATLFVLNNEIMSYETATLTGPNVYDLDSFRRGLYGTTTASHTTGTKFARLDEAVFKIAYTDLNYGEMMYIKLPSFNPFGNSVEDLSTVTAYSVTLLDSAQAVDWRVVADQKAITGFLTNESHTVATASDGTGYSLSGAGGNFFVYSGSVDVSATTTFSVVGSATKNGLTISINSSGAYTLSGSSWTSDSETFTLQAIYDGVAIPKDYSISKSKAGTSGTGASLLYLAATAQTFTYDGSNSPTPSSQTITFTANVQNLTGTVVFSAVGYDYSGTSLGAITLSGSGDTRTMSNTQFGAAAYAVVTASLSGFTDTVTVVRLKNGANGTNGTSATGVTLSREAVQLFAYADGTVPSFATAVGQMKVYSGATDVTSSSTFSATPSAGVTGSITTLGAYSVTGMTTTTGSLTLVATYGGVNFTRVFSLSKVLTGYEIVSALPTTNLFQGRMVFLTSNNKLYRNTDGTFAGWTVSVPAVDITGQITETQITDDAVTTAKIAANAVTANEIEANTITADQISAGAITAATVSTNEIIANSANIKDGVISTAKIGDAQITTAKIDDLQVSTLKIANQAVTIPISAYTAAATTVIYNTWTTIQQATITSTGAPISIFVNAMLKFLGDHTSTFSGDVDFRVLRNATNVFSGTVRGLTILYNSSGPDYNNFPLNDISSAFQDTPGAGSVTYYLQVYYPTSGQFNSNSTVSNRSILLLETKK